MATITVNGSNANVSFINAENIATIGTSSFNTTALAKDGGTGRLVIDINPALIGYGTVNSVKISYKAYGSRTGLLGSKAQIRTGYWNYNGGGYVDVNTHGDVGRGSSNATSYTDTIYPVLSSSSGFELFFKITNPIATQTNTVYVSNISITIDYTPASYKVSTNVSPLGSGTVTGSGTYNHGSTATLVATANDGYNFVKWNDDNKENPRTITVTGNATYTAIFTPITYTITFKDYDGTIIPVNGQNSQTVEYGKLPVEPPTPTRPSTPQHRYEFNGWSPTIETATRDIAYFAQYTEIEIFYTITWLNYDGSLLKTYDDMPYGSIPVYDGDTPIRPSTAQYSYEFNGWDPPIDKVNGIVGDTVYVAKFKENLRNYPVSVKDGTVTLLSGSKVGDNYEYGSILEITANEKEGYKFLGWSGNSSSTEKTIRYTVISEAIFEALYKKLQMLFKSIKMFNHSKNELISPLNPLESGEEVIVEVKIVYE